MLVKLRKISDDWFSYRWGGNIGALQISTLTNLPTGQQQTLIWQRNETQPREWRMERVTLRDVPYGFSLKIDGFIGNGWEGDVCQMRIFSSLEISN